MAQQQPQVLAQRVFLAGPPQWDSCITAVKTQTVAKEVWQFADPDGNGPSKSTTPPEITLECFMTKFGIPLPTANAVPNPAQPAQPAQGNPQPAQGNLQPAQGNQQ